MDAAGRALIISIFLAMILGLGVAMAKNGNSPIGMFDNWTDRCAKSNRRYYAHITVDHPADSGEEKR